MQHDTKLEMTFENFSLIKVDFSLNQDFVNDGKTETIISPDVMINHEVRKEQNGVVVIIGVRQKEGNLPYRFEVQAGGLFKFKEWPDEKMIKQLVTINLPSILFPYLRETIADLTRRAGFPPLHLAPINFIELAKNLQERKTKKIDLDEAKEKPKVK
ncbi:MAG: protein-export chaperone SecB [Dissulfurispiraceae bacterium]